MVLKTKNVWACAHCGHKQPKWLGQCPQCAQWNCLHEEVELAPRPSRFPSRAATASQPVSLKEVSLAETPRWQCGLPECDRLLGGGLIPGSLTLVGGDPGIGKSTLLLQLSAALASQGLLVLYVCGEESVVQTSLRAQRLGIDTDHLLLFSETNFALIQAQIEAKAPRVVIVDSIQLMYKEEVASAPGSVAQVRETAAEFMHIAKSQGIAIFLIGHVTKAGEIAGPRVLEHIVDTVLYFEGDKQHHYRIVRVVKNRFGATDEIGVFQMCAQGLKEVANPSSIFLEERTKGLIGSTIIPTLEGSRPILIEVQALVSETVFPSPSRRSTGIDPNRLALLLAVLEKRMRYPLFRSDVFVSVAGGIKTAEPAADLGILLAVASSFRNRRVDPDTLVVGEVGLGGEIRSVPRLESRLKEAVHMGFSRCLIPRRNAEGLSQSLKEKIRVQSIQVVEEAIEAALS